MGTTKKISERSLQAQIRNANSRNSALRKTEPRAASAHYHADEDSLHIVLTNGASLEIPVDLIDEFSGADRSQLHEVEVDPLGKGLRWRSLDVGLDFPVLLERMLGKTFSSSAARHLGKSTSAKKARAARANGLKGGRPKGSRARGGKTRRPGRVFDPGPGKDQIFPMLLDRDQIARLCIENDVRLLRLFGSVARGDDREDSDIDLLVEFRSPKSLITQVGIEDAFAASLGRKVDLLTPAALSPYIRDRVLKESQVLFADES